MRHAQIHDSGKVETHLLAKHQGRAHKLAIEPGSPHIFYTCGEDGLVQHVSHFLSNLKWLVLTVSVENLLNRTKTYRDYMSFVFRVVVLVRKFGIKSSELLIKRNYIDN